MQRVRGLFTSARRAGPCPSLQAAICQTHRATSSDDRGTPAEASHRSGWLDNQQEHWLDRRFAGAQKDSGPNVVCPAACLPDSAAILQALGRGWRLQIADGGCKRSRPGAGDHCIQLCAVWPLDRTSRGWAAARAEDTGRGRFWEPQPGSSRLHVPTCCSGCVLVDLRHAAVLPSY